MSELTIEAFSATVKSQLLDVIDPRFGSVHDHKFEVQNARWQDPYSQTTGFPLRSYSDRLAELRTIPPCSLLEARKDRSMSEAEALAWEETHPTSPIGALAASRMGGSMKSVKKMVQKQALAYMKSNPGRESLAPNINPHRLIRTCIEKPDTLGDEAWEGAYRILHYRINIMIAAERIVMKMGVEFPAASNMDMDAWELREGADTRKLAGEYHELTYDLVPPMPGTWRLYYKAVEYIAAACASSGIPKEEMEKRLEKAQQSMYFVLYSYLPF